MNNDVDLLLKAFQETNSLSNEHLDEVISHFKMMLDGIRAFRDPKYFLFEKEMQREHDMFMDCKRHHEENFQLTPAK
jgi:hypothetical protein